MTIKFDFSIWDTSQNPPVLHKSAKEDIIDFVREVGEIAGYFDLPDCTSKIRLIITSGCDLNIHLSPEKEMFKEYYRDDIKKAIKKVLHASRSSNIKIGNYYGDLFIQLDPELDKNHNLVYDLEEGWL